MAKSSTRYVYVIGPDGGPWRVGTVRDPRRHLAQLQAVSVLPLFLVALVALEERAARAAERAIRYRLRAARLEGEWFSAPLAAVDGAVLSAAPGTQLFASDKRPLSAAAAKLPTKPGRPRRMGEIALPGLLPTTADRRSSDGVDPSDVAGAFAGNTRRAYASDWKAWVDHCRTRGITAIPADPAAVAAYAAELAERLRVSSIRRRIAAIACVHRIARQPFDRSHPALDFKMRRLAREKGTAPTPKAELLTADIIALLEAAPPGLAGLRDRALILAGFAGAFRRSELAELKVEHIEWKRDGALFVLPRSKTNQEGRREVVAIRYGARERTCPLRAIKRWLEAAAIADGYVFRAVIHDRLWAERMSGRAISERVKALARAAGLDVERIAAHSLRAGHITQALDNGGDLGAAAKQARHRKLDTTRGYDRGLGLLREGNTSAKLGL